VSNVPYVEDQGEQADDYDSDAEFERAVDAMEEEMENDRGGATIQSEEKIENQMEDETVESDAQPEGIITQFNPDHIITDPGLRIPIDQFHVDIRSDVRRASLSLGLSLDFTFTFLVFFFNVRFLLYIIYIFLFVYFMLDERKSLNFTCIQGNISFKSYAT
jgi:hypothetical protein